MKRNVLFCLMWGCLFLLAWGHLHAGPLDRGNTGAREKPATKSMLRVPGTVGQYCSMAFATLQGVGLKPVMEEIRQKDERYEGLHGLIVEQVPAAGGVAMIGSSINIICYIGESVENGDAVNYNDSLPESESASGTTSGDAVAGDGAAESYAGQQNEILSGQEPHQ